MFGRITPIVRNLLILNVALFALERIFHIDLSDLFGLRYILADTFAPYQFITYMFLHFDLFHLFSNMFALFIFGPLLEQFWGPKRFLIYYMVTGIGAGILYSGINYFETSKLRNDTEKYLESPTPGRFSDFIAAHGTIGRIEDQYYNLTDQAVQIEDELYKNPDNKALIENSKQIVSAVYYRTLNSGMIGASGAVFGILLAFGMLFPNTTLILLFPPIPIKAKYLVTFYGLFELYSGIKRAPGDNVAHFAHLAGMLVGYILLKIWQKGRKNFF